jgi:GNAT superfamily N-acetyltransferase
VTGAPDPADVRLRPATPADVDVLAGHRVAMFRDMGQIADEGAAEALAAATRGYLSEALVSGEYRAWLAILADGTVVAGAGVQLRRVMPSPGPPGAAPLVTDQARLLNVYTEPAWRRRGLGERLVREALAWAAASGVSSVTLNASAAGRALYARLGFVATHEMIYRPAAGSPPTVP